MKKTFLSLVAAFAVISTNLSASSFEERMNFCDKLTMAMPNVVHIAEDAYAIEHHVARTSCIEHDPEEWTKLISESNIYVYLLAVQFNLNPITNSRVQKACANLTYEILVDQAIKSNVDTTEGMKEIVVNYGDDKISALSACSKLSEKKDEK